MMVSRNRGSALILVLISLSMMVALGVAFLLSGRLRSGAGRELFSKVESQIALESASSYALLQQVQSHPALDPTPRFDSNLEWNPFREDPLPAAIGEEWRDDRQAWGFDVEALQGRVSLATAPPVLLQNLVRPCFLNEDVDFSSERFPVTSTAGFPEEGSLVISGLWIQYSGIEAQAFTGVLPPPEEEIPDDLEQTRFRAGTLLLDPRILNLALARIGPQGWKAPEFLDDVFAADPSNSGLLPEVEIQNLSRLVWLQTGRFGHGPWGPGDRLLRLPNDVAPNVARLFDAGGFSSGDTVRFEPEVGDSWDVLVISARGNNLTLLGSVPLDFEPPHVRVRPLLREPVDLNSARPEVLQALVLGLRWSARPSMPEDSDQPHSGNWRLDWISTSLANRFAQAVILSRPLTGPADLWARVLGPMAEEGTLSDWQAFAIHQNGLDPGVPDLLHSTMPFAYRTGDSYLQRVDAVVRTRLGARSGRASAVELVRSAPEGRSLRIWQSQADYQMGAEGGRGMHGTHSLPSNLGVASGSWHPRNALPMAVGASPWATPAIPATEVESSAILPTAVRENDTYGNGATGITQHFDSLPSAQGWDASLMGPHERLLSEWGVAENTSGLSALSPLHIQSWFWIPPGVTDAALFDLLGPELRSQRIRASLQEGNLVVQGWDNAGDDPLDPDQLEQAVTVEISGVDYPLEDRWLHLSTLMRGISPRGLQVAVDGVPRGTVSGLTWLTGTLSAFSPGSLDGSIAVESTEGFPSRGALRIGDEVLEYSSKTADSFVLDPVRGPDGWLGGRAAREANDILAGSLDSDHPSGAAVELYGYSSFLQSNIPPGGGRLSGDIGPWSVATAITDDDTINVMSLFGGSFTIGQGFNGAWLGDLELATMIAGDPYYSDAFQSDGGYALLFQPRTGWDDVDGYRIGGYEIIRYASRLDGFLKIIERNVQTPGVLREDGTMFAPQGTSYVTLWNPNISNAAGETLDSLETWRVFVAPISIKGAGVSDFTFLAPTEEQSEMVQIFDSNDSSLTEWVRYDAILNGCFVRDDPLAIRAAVGSYVFDEGLPVPSQPPGNGNRPGGGGWRAVLPPPRQPSPQQQGSSSFVSTLGEPVEDRDSALEIARQMFRFRGVVNTFDHAHAAGASLIPVFRTYRSSGPWSGFVGRLDRVAVMQPPEVTPPQWFTVEWGSVPTPDSRLPVGVTWVAFREDPGLPVIASPASTLDPSQASFDPRLVARLSKFPSGERPMFLDTLALGSDMAGEAPPFPGFLDESSVQTVAGMGNPSTTLARCAFVLSIDLEATETDEFTLNASALVLGSQRLWASNRGDYFGLLPPSGLMDMGGERIAYSDFDTATGIFTISPNGRGLHGTEPRGHAAGASVWIVDGRPATTLTNDMEVGETQFSLQSTAGFSPWSLLLVDQELVHTPLALPGGSLGMPRLAPADPLGDPGDGLLRGRFGTVAAAHSGGTLVYSFPTRFSDRWIPLGPDLAEASWFELSFDEPGAWWRGLRFDVELPGAGQRLHVLARSGSATWRDIPGETPGFLRVEENFDSGGLAPLDLRSDRLDLRFYFDWDVGSFDPISFEATGWLREPRLRSVLVDFMSESRVERQLEVRE